jgi:hypothetical protein
MLFNQSTTKSSALAGLVEAITLNAGAVTTAERVPEASSEKKLGYLRRQVDRVHVADARCRRYPQLNGTRRSIE